jgi:hypothetical protein
MALSGALRTYNSSELSLLNYGVDVFRVRDIELMVPWKRQSSAELYKFLTNTGTGSVLSQPKFEFGASRDKYPDGVIVKAAAAAGDVNLTVYDAYMVVPGMRLVCDRTGEHLRVSSVTDGSTIVCAATTGYGRGFAETTASALVIGDKLRFTTNLVAEFGHAPGVRRRGPSPMRWNYPEFWRAAWSTSTMQEGTVMIDGIGQIGEAEMMEMWAHQEGVNAAMWLGRRYFVEEADGPLYVMDGFDAQVTKHNADLSNVVTAPWTFWNEMFLPVFQESASSGSKDLYCGPNVYSTLVNSARAVGLKPENQETIWGTSVTQLVLDEGYTVNIIKDYEFFKGARAGDARLVDGGYVEFRPYNGWQQKIIPNIEDNDQKGIVVKHMLLEGGSMKVDHPECHMKLTGFRGPFGI